MTKMRVDKGNARLCTGGFRTLQHSTTRRGPRPYFGIRPLDFVCDRVVFAESQRARRMTSSHEQHVSSGFPWDTLDIATFIGDLGNETGTASFKNDQNASFNKYDTGFRPLGRARGRRFPASSFSASRSVLQRNSSGILRSDFESVS